MKLPDFSTEENLNDLRKTVGADYIDWSGASGWNPLDINDLLRKLVSAGEVELDIKDLTFAKDNTLELKGRKVIVYIRDQYKRYYDEGYKFRISSCDVLLNFQRDGRYFGRYVAKITIDNSFLVNILEGYGSRIVDTKTIEMKVCKRCLYHLNYKKYARTYSKDVIYTSFSLEEFFSIYPSNGVTQPIHTERTSPTNLYPSDFEKIAVELKTRHGYTCQECATSYRHDTEQIHVHHLNSNKGDNRLSNLMVLCKACHAKRHPHMR